MLLQRTCHVFLINEQLYLHLSTYFMILLIPRRQIRVPNPTTGLVSQDLEKCGKDQRWILIFPNSDD